MVFRHAEASVKEALADTPVVVIQGPRQCGKTTLAQSVAGDMAYVTLDDPLSLDQAKRNPMSFLAAFPQGAVIDEVQRAPELFRSLKAAVDRDRRPGRFLLTGSANVLLLPRLSESLAGRMEVVELWPFSMAERLEAEPSFARRLLQGEGPQSEGGDWRTLAEGGFPEPLARASESRRAAWYEAYIKALVERDVRDLSDIEGLTALPRLLRLMALEASEPLNVSALSRDSGIAASTLTRYISLLDGVFLTRPLPAWQSGLRDRAIKGARVGFVDSGLLCHLLGLTPARLEPGHAMTRRVLLNALAMELRKQSRGEWEVCHFRSIRRYETPIVLVRPDGMIAGIDFTTDAAPSIDSARGLEFLAGVAQDRFAGGAILHLGRGIQAIGEKVWAAPIASAWS